MSKQYIGTLAQVAFFAALGLVLGLYGLYIEYLLGRDVSIYLLEQNGYPMQTSVVSCGTTIAFVGMVICGSLMVVRFFQILGRDESVEKPDNSGSKEKTKADIDRLNNPPLPIFTLHPVSRTAAFIAIATLISITVFDPVCASYYPYWPYYP